MFVEIHRTVFLFFLHIEGQVVRAQPSFICFKLLRPRPPCLPLLETDGLVEDWPQISLLPPGVVGPLTALRGLLASSVRQTE